MGYTHYWQRPAKLPAAAFGRAVADCRRLLPQLGVPLGGAWGTGEPQLVPDAIVFNGRPGQSCETLRIDQIASGRRNAPTVAEFCKTAQLPYDLAVQVALIVFQHHLRRHFRVTSDGSSTAWDHARQICQEHLGYGEDFQLDTQ